MAKTSLIISNTDSTTGKKLQKTLTDINSAATNDELKTFAQAVNAVTTNTYGESNRVDRINVDTEESATVSKLFREITVTDAAKNATAKISFKRTEDEASYGGVSLTVFYYNTQESTAEKLTTSSVSSEAPTALYHVTIPNYNGRLYVEIEATEDFYSEFVKLTISS